MCCAASGMPMARTCRAPVQVWAWGSTRPGLAAAKLTVAVARMASGMARPVRPSRPEGMSSASTKGWLGRALTVRTSSSASGRSVPLKPVPNRPSIIIWGRADPRKTAGRQRSNTTPAARAMRTCLPQAPLHADKGRVCSTSGSAPASSRCRARQAASPPLLPLPISSHVRRPASSGRYTRKTSSAARAAFSISSSSGRPRARASASHWRISSGRGRGEKRS